MKILVSLAAAAVLWPAFAHAEDCKLEHWKTRHNAVMGMFIVEGVTTCDDGRIIMRLYDGEDEGRKFIGFIRETIRDGTFREIITGVDEKPRNLTVEYTIKPR